MIVFLKFVVEKNYEKERERETVFSLSNVSRFIIKT